MKKQDITNLYDQLTPKEKALMAYEAEIEGDSDTASEIRLTIPKLHYSALDREFGDIYDGFISATNVWAIMYWQFYSKLLSSTVQSLSAAKEKDIERVEKMEEFEHYWRERLKVLGMIVRGLNESHGIGLESFPKAADVKRVYGLDDDEESLSIEGQEFLRHYLHFFQTLIDGVGAHEETQAYIRGESVDGYVN